MPGEFDLTEMGNLRDIPGMIRGMGIPYTAPGTAAQSPGMAGQTAQGGIPIAAILSYLASVAPWALAGGAGLIQGGSSDPNIPLRPPPGYTPPMMNSVTREDRWIPREDAYPEDLRPPSMIPRFRAPLPPQTFAPIPRFRAIPPIGPAPRQPYQF